MGKLGRFWGTVESHIKGMEPFRIAPSSSKSVRPCKTTGRIGFTLVELLVVIGIIALLISILIPILGKANAAARTANCASNIRQICQALILYAGANRGQFPPNVTSPSAQWWYDQDRIGRLLTPIELVLQGPVATCPDDPEAVRSYAMNIYASSNVPAAVRSAGNGTLWKQNTAGSSKLLLVSEGWSTDGSAKLGFSTPATIGMRGSTPGARFGGGAGINPLYNAKRWGQVNCELAYNRHRSVKISGAPTQPIGRLNIGYADGHVALKSNADLVSPSTGLSTLDTLWSRKDYELNK